LVCTPTKHLYLNNMPTPNIYTLSLHDALPIFSSGSASRTDFENAVRSRMATTISKPCNATMTLSDPPKSSSHCKALKSSLPCARSEEHTSELQSLTNLVCRLLLEKTKHTIRRR